MKKLERCRILLGGMLVLGGTCAHAADMSAPVYTKAPMIEAIYNWTGFYAGAHAGYIWGNSYASAADTAALTATYGRTPKPQGGFGGLHGGYNYQLANKIVVGGEITVEGLGINGLKDSLGIAPGSALNVSTNWVVGVVGKLGYAMDRWMPYVFAGGAYAHDKENGFNPFIGAFALSNSHLGWTAGAGAEYAFSKQWSARLQYRYVDIDRQQYNKVLVGGTGSGIDVGASYHF